MLRLLWLVVFLTCVLLGVSTSAQPEPNDPYAKLVAKASASVHPFSTVICSKARSLACSLARSALPLTAGLRGSVIVKTLCGDKLM